MKKSVALIMSISIIVSLLSITSTNSFAGTGNVWVMPSVTPVMRNEATPANPSGSMAIEMAQNEYEGGQIIVTAGSGGINSMSVSAGVLTHETDVSKTIASPEIMVQHYIGSTAGGAKIYPDALIPYAEYIQKHNQLSVAANENQGLWFTYQTDPATVPGTYSGSIVITVDGLQHTVPVEVKVWDFALTDESHSLTAFGNWGGLWADASRFDQLSSVYPSITVEGSDLHHELWENYYQFYLDHRVSSYELPVTYDSSNLSVMAGKMADLIHKYPQMSAFEIPVDYQIRDYETSYDPNNPPTTGELYDGTVLSLLEHLTDALVVKGYTLSEVVEIFNSKTYFYLGDEPPNTATYHGMGEQATNQLRQIEADLEASKFSSPHMEIKLRNMSAINSFQTGLIGKVDVLCPNTDDVAPYLYPSTFVDDEMAEGREVWWYGMYAPTTPYTEYHIATPKIDERLQAWMERRYNIGGNLYWSGNVNRKYNGSQYVDRDVWNDPIAFTGLPAGDGFLTYPGEEYGIFGPISTIRFENIRDGYEDYEMLWLLENRLEAIAQQLGVEVSPELIMQPLYDRLFTAINDYNQDASIHKEVRAEVAAMIEGLNSNPKMIAFFSNVDSVSGNKELMIYTEAGTSVSVDGAAVSSVQTIGNADHFIAETTAINGVNHVTVSASKSGQSVTLSKSFVRLDDNVSELINSFEDATDISTANIGTNNSVVALADAHMTQGQNSLSVSHNANADFPGINLHLNGLDISRADQVAFDVYNSSSAYRKIYAKFFDGNGSSVDRHVATVPPGERRAVKVDVSLLSSLNTGNMDRIELWTWRDDNSFTIHYDNLRLVKSGKINITAIPTSSPAFQNLDRITNGNKHFNDYADSYPNNGLTWIQLDLGVAHDVNKINLWRYYWAGRSYRDTVVQLSNTSDFSSGVTTVFNNDTDNSAGFGIGTDSEYAETEDGKTFEVNSVNARYVRIYTNGSDYNAYSHFVEVEVFGTESTTTVPVVTTVQDSVTGTGINQFEFVGNWSSGPVDHWSNTTDDYYQVRFDGTQIKLYAALDPGHGIAAVSIDGGPEVDVDLYASARADTSLVFTSDVLSQGTHTLKVRVSGRKNSTASNDYVVADKVEIVE